MTATNMCSNFGSKWYNLPCDSSSSWLASMWSECVCMMLYTILKLNGKKIEYMCNQIV